MTYDHPLCRTSGTRRATPRAVFQSAVHGSVRLERVCRTATTRETSEVAKRVYRATSYDGRAI